MLELRLKSRCFVYCIFSISEISLIEKNSKKILTTL
jgi:hypothetical protein